eukprot:CAMPEP_0176064076 /NCGR_PEP_ID=MMETSP0120_2-20121206/31958_1 /TAXON_ID=160619 /ORGANISM="Kryptoperidinium foliaceum, Strain CCMP 1326" /LENGTH=199 /DNA_ID=CAMNT_0017397649 /DNA_START=30 /DNA_END=629 /DNA_ORIENTATION=-
MATASSSAGGGGGGGSGGVASAAGRLAVDGAKATANATSRSVVMLSTYVAQNPTSVKFICCLLGLALSVASVLSMFNLIGNEEAHEKWDRSRTMQSAYIFFFGMVIVFCELREEWANKGCELQVKLFRYFYFLATQPGRAVFYFYVGSVSLLMWPESDLWKWIYLSLGGALCLLGAIMIGLRCLQCCRGEAPDEPQASA